MKARQFMAAAMALAGACGFSPEGTDHPGLGSGNDVGDATSAAMSGETQPSSTDDGSGSADGTGGEEGIGSITSPSTTAGADDTGTAQGEGGGSSTGAATTGDACDNPPFFKVIVDAEDAILGAPMMLWTPAGDESFVATTDDNAGVASFYWEAPCNDVYWLWALVWDANPRPLPEGPDSFDVGLSDGGTTLWRYGCQTTLLGGGWHWLRVQETISCVFDEDVIEYQTDPGARVFEFDGHEGGTFNAADPPGDLAALSRILITNDPDYTPGPGD